MEKKEIAEKADLLWILDLLDSMNMKYWVDGGWGIDILLGQQKREHRDVDINFDGTYTDALLEKLTQQGCEITTDWRPCRIELYHPDRSYLDIHPLTINEDGSAKQAAPDGGWYELEADWFSSASFEGRIIPCISAEAQKLFHSGYELREKDRIDIQNLEEYLLKNDK